MNWNNWDIRGGRGMMYVQERLLTNASHHLLGCISPHNQQEKLVVGCVLFFSMFSKCHQGVVGGHMGKRKIKKWVCFKESSTNTVWRSSSLESWPCATILCLLLIRAKRDWLIIIFMRLQRQSGSDLDFSLNVLMRALELRKIKGDTVLEIWGRDIIHICHRPLG